MRGTLTKIFGDRYLVRCAKFPELVIVRAENIEPPCMNKNLREWFGNSNGDEWATGGHIEFEIRDGQVILAMVCLQGR